MSRYLFTAWAGGGAVPPLVSVGRALAGRGHDVRFLADPALREEIEGAGLAMRPWTRAPHVTTLSREDDLIKDWEARTPAGGLARMRDRVAIAPAGRYAADVLEELGREPADVLVSEVILAGPQIAAEVSGVPSAILSSTVLPLPAPGIPPFGPGFMPASGPLGRLRDRVVGRIGDRMWNRALPALNATRAEYGLEPVDGVLRQPLRADRLLVLTSRAFDFPSSALPSNVVYTGPRLDDPAWAGEWTPPAGEEPLVLVALSSTFQDQVPLLRRVAEALGELPVRGLVTTGPFVAPGDVPAPANVTVVRSAPHREVLPHAAAVVTHGGHGTVMKALANGVPLVVAPMGRDQADVAARVVASGAGIRVGAKAPATKLGAAVRRLLDEPAFTAAAGRMQTAIAAELEEDRAVAELETLAGHRNGASRRPVPA